jgi:hypothetical protein
VVYAGRHRIALLIPLLVFLLTPLVRPVSWVQILFTYLVPILPVLIFWDGLISQLRTYSVQELEEFTRGIFGLQRIGGKSG